MLLTRSQRLKKSWKKVWKSSNSRSKKGWKEVEERLNEAWEKAKQNSIYSKISKANEMVILSLIKAYCQPVLLYSLEALDLNASMMNSLDNPLFLAVGRIFKTYDKLIVNSCMYYMNIWPLRYEYLNRKISFLYKLRNVENSLLSVLHQAFGANELSKIREDLKPGNNHISSLRGCLWNRFANSIVLT